MYSSGSNIFGNSVSNVQQFTGSLQVSGSSHNILGNVGIGIAIPTNPLHIQSNTLSQLNVTALSGNTNAQINLEPTGTGIALIGPANNVDLAFRTNATIRLRLDKDGNLGLGATPSTWSLFSGVLELNGGSSIGGFANITYFNQNAIFNSGWKYLSTNAAGRYELGQEHKWFNAPSGTAGNAISFTQAMTLDASGRLGIGETSPSEKLHLKNSSGTGNFIRFQDTAGGGVYIGGRSENMELYAGNAERMRITSAGEVNIGGVSTVFPVLTVKGIASSPHIGSTWSVSANQDGTGRTIIGTAGQGRSMYFENNGDIVIPNNTLEVGGSVRANGFKSYSGTSSIASGATSTIHTMSANGLYTVQVIVNAGSLIYSAAAIFIAHNSNAQYVKTIDLYDGPNVTLDNSGSAIRITNGGFSTFTWNWSILFQPF